MADLTRLRGLLQTSKDHSEPLYVRVNAQTQLSLEMEVALPELLEDAERLDWLEQDATYRTKEWRRLIFHYEANTPLREAIDKARGGWPRG